MRWLIMGTQLAVILGALNSRAVGDETIDEIMAQGKTALSKGQIKDALALADKAVALDGKQPRGYFFRALVHESARRHEQAIADYTKVIELNPKAGEAFDRRGSEHFKLGHFAESIADFDRFLELKPAEAPGHWRRGISCYYGGRFEDGWKQFKGYEKVDTNDVENAVWHYLCLARAAGADTARESMLKIGTDKRVPLMLVYELFKGKAKPEDVLAAVHQGNPAAQELRNRLFYAHLYLGLYYESLGDKKQTLAHMRKAAEDYAFPHYMGDVARVHLALLQKQSGQGK